MGSTIGMTTLPLLRNDEVFHKRYENGKYKKNKAELKRLIEKSKIDNCHFPLLVQFKIEDIWFSFYE